MKKQLLSLILLLSFPVIQEIQAMGSKAVTAAAEGFEPEQCVSSAFERVLKLAGIEGNCGTLKFDKGIDEETVRQVEEAMKKEGWTKGLLASAMRGGFDECLPTVKLLIDNNVEGLSSALSWLMQTQNFDTLDCKHPDFKKLVSVLLAAGARIDHHNEHRENPIHLALNPSQEDIKNIISSVEPGSDASKLLFSVPHSQARRLATYQWFKKTAEQILLRDGKRTRELEYLREFRLPYEDAKIQFRVHDALVSDFCPKIRNIICEYVRTNRPLMLSWVGRVEDEDIPHEKKNTSGRCAIA